MPALNPTPCQTRLQLKVAQLRLEYDQLDEQHGLEEPRIPPPLEGEPRRVAPAQLAFRGEDHPHYEAVQRAVAAELHRLALLDQLDTAGAAHDIADRVLQLVQELAA